MLIVPTISKKVRSRALGVSQGAHPQGPRSGHSTCSIFVSAEEFAKLPLRAEEIEVHMYEPELVAISIRDHHGQVHESFARTQRRFFGGL